MTLLAEWQLMMSKPSAARTATIALGVMWAVAAVWGWFFVEPTVLRDSQVAQNFVDFATSVFPWLNNIKKLGPDAEKGLFLHSVYFFALAPIAIVWSLVVVSRANVVRLITAETLLNTIICCVFMLLLNCLLIWIMYRYIFQLSFGKLHRTGYSFAVSAFTVPFVAPFFIIGFWHVLYGTLHFAYLSIIKMTARF